MSIEPAIPVISGSIVPRKALLTKLRAATSRRLTLLVAAAGSGKSVLMAQLAASELDREVIWLSLCPADANPARLAHRLLDAFRQHFEGFAPDADALGVADESIGAGALDVIIADLANLPEVLVIVDDLHHVTDELAADVGALVRSAPPQVRFVIASRVDPSDGFTGLEMLGEVSRFGQEALAFTPEEEAEVVQRVARVELDGAQRTMLHGKTEGWAAAVQVAAIALRTRSDVDGFIDGYYGNHRTLSRYLREELLDNQPPDIRDFMLRTSVVDTICAPLAEVLTGRTDSQAVLEQLERSSLLVTPVDGRRERFRYHQLFAEMLRSELRSLDLEEARELTKRAALWNLERNELFAAGDLLVRAEAWEELVEMVIQRSLELLEEGYHGSTLRWTQAVPAAFVRRSQRGALVLAGQARTLGNSATAEALIAQIEAAGFSDSYVEADVHLLHCMGVQYEEPLESVLEHAEAIWAWAADPGPPPDDPYFSPMENPEFMSMQADLYAGRAEDYLDNPAVARKLLARASQGHAYWSARVGALGSLAHAEARAGDLHRATSWASESVRFAAEHGLEGHLSSIDTKLTLGMLARERNDLPEAAQRLEEAGVLARKAKRTAVVAMQLAESCLLAIGTGEHTAAITAAESFRRDVARQAVPRVASTLLAAEARLWTSMGDLERAERLLSLSVPMLDTLSAAAALALERRDVDTARSVLEAWPALETVKARLERLIWTAVLAEEVGEQETATSRMASALRLGETYGHLRTFVDAGIVADRLIRRCADAEPTSYAGTVLAAARPQANSKSNLSGRELAVLRRLATPESNRIIAERLFISTNTLKTHLRRIYRKLGVSNRREAVHRAVAEGLIGPTPWTDGEASF